MRTKIITIAATLGIITLAGCSAQTDNKPTSTSDLTLTSGSAVTEDTSTAIIGAGEAVTEVGESMLEESAITSAASMAISTTEEVISVASEAIEISEGTTEPSSSEAITELDPNSLVITQANKSDDSTMDFGDIIVKIDIKRISFTYDDVDELQMKIPVKITNHSEKPNGLSKDGVSLLYNKKPLNLTVSFGGGDYLYEAVEPDATYESAIYTKCQGKGAYVINITHAGSTMTYSFIIR